MSSDEQTEFWKETMLKIDRNLSLLVIQRDKLSQERKSRVVRFSLAMSSLSMCRMRVNLNWKLEEKSLFQEGRTVLQVRG